MLGEVADQGDWTGMFGFLAGTSDQQDLETADQLVR